MRRSIATTADRGSELATWAWLGDRELPAKSEVRERTQSLDWGLATYWLALLACSSLFGLVVGGYVGYMNVATPAVDAPGRFAQLVTSDVQWTAKARQHWAASHGFTSSAHDSSGSHWQHWAGHVAMHDGSGISSDASLGCVADSVGRAVVTSSDEQKMVVTQ